MNKKLFIVKKYVYATSAKDAIKKEKETQVDDVWVDEEWKKNQLLESKNIGYGE